MNPRHLKSIRCASGVRVDSPGQRPRTPPDVAGPKAAEAGAMVRLRAFSPAALPHKPSPSGWAVNSGAFGARALARRFLLPCALAGATWLNGHMLAQEKPT